MSLYWSHRADCTDYRSRQSAAPQHLEMRPTHEYGVWGTTKQARRSNKRTFEHAADDNYDGQRGESELGQGETAVPLAMDRGADGAASAAQAGSLVGIGIGHIAMCFNAMLFEGDVLT